MKICLFPTDKSQCKTIADDKLILLVPPYRSEDSIFLNDSKSPNKGGYCFSSWDEAAQFLHYQAAQRAAVSVYPIITRCVTDTSSIKTPEKARKLFLKNVISALNQGAPTMTTAKEVAILRLVYGEKKVSRSELLKRFSWMGSSSEALVHQVIIEAGHEPFDYKNWSEIALQEVALSWVKNQQFEDIVHWCMFAMLYYQFDFSTEIYEKLRKLYNDAFKEQQRIIFLESGGHKREPWQKKIRTRR